MKKTPHIIWGRTPLTDEKIRTLKMQGIEKVFVRDSNQSKKVKEENGVFYLSPEGVNSFFGYETETVNLMYLRPGARRKK